NTNVHAGTGNDRIIAAGGNNNLFGDDGNDTFVMNSFYNSTVNANGGPGNDTLEIDGTSANDVVTAVMLAPNQLQVKVNGLTSTFQLTSVENLSFNLGDGDDSIILDLTGGPFGFTSGIGV